MNELRDITRRASTERLIDHVLMLKKAMDIQDLSQRKQMILEYFRNRNSPEDVEKCDAWIGSLASETDKWYDIFLALYLDRINN